MLGQNFDVTLTFSSFFEPNRTGGRGIWWAGASRVSKADYEVNNSSVRPMGMNACAFLFQHERSVLLVSQSVEMSKCAEPGRRSREKE